MNTIKKDTRRTRLTVRLFLALSSSALLFNVFSCAPKTDKQATENSPAPTSEQHTTATDTTSTDTAHSTNTKWVIPAAYPEGEAGEQIRFGEELVTNTTQYLGPDVADPSLRIAGNHLSCKNCHLQGGKQANAIGFVGVSQRYPKYRGRENRVASLAERINGCFERSLNGTKLPEDSKEMQAMLAYMNWLSEGIDGKNIEGQGLPKLEFIDRAADPDKGKLVYTQNCALCHGPNGEGVAKDPKNSSAGYTFPPLWGPDSYNNGAGMNRVHTAAQFIHANMPLGNANLSVEQAYDVSAYINSQDRPEKAEREKDYPDLTKKPVDAPYGPYPDDFSAEQHKYGPFGPMKK